MNAQRRPSTDPPVLICFDGSAAAADAVREAARLFPDRPAVVACVWVRPMVSNGYVPYAFAVPPQVQAEAERKAKEAAWATAQRGAGLAREAGLDAEALAVPTGAGTWPALLSIADERKVAALVAGRRGLSGIKSVLLGSVSAGLVHHSRRPVLIVPTGVRPPEPPLRAVASAEQLRAGSP